MLWVSTNKIRWQMWCHKNDCGLHFSQTEVTQWVPWNVKLLCLRLNNITGASKSSPKFEIRQVSIHPFGLKSGACTHVISGLSPPAADGKRGDDDDDGPFCFAFRKRVACASGYLSYLVNLQWYDYVRGNIYTFSTARNKPRKRTKSSLTIFFISWGKH